MSAVLSRATARDRVVAAARGAVLLGGWEPISWDEVGASAGVSRRAVRTLFRDEDDLWDAVTAQLVRETAERLAAVDTGAPAHAADPLLAARLLSHAVIRARPLDRSGVLLRLERRARALRSTRAGVAMRAAESAYLRELGARMPALLEAVGRAPRIPLQDFTRILLNTYERAFEAWLAAGRPESRFDRSPFATDTLPTLILALSHPSRPAPPHRRNR